MHLQAHTRSEYFPKGGTVARFQLADRGESLDTSTARLLHITLATQVEKNPAREACHSDLLSYVAGYVIVSLM